MTTTAAIATSARPRTSGGMRFQSLLTTPS